MTCGRLEAGGPAAAAPRVFPGPGVVYSGGVLSIRSEDEGCATECRDIETVYLEQVIGQPGQQSVEHVVEEHSAQAHAPDRAEGKITDPRSECVARPQPHEPPRCGGPRLRSPSDARAGCCGCTTTPTSRTPSWRYRR